MTVKFIFKLILADVPADDLPIRPTELGPLYQNQEAHPQVPQRMMDECFFSDDELPDLPETSN